MPHLELDIVIVNWNSGDLLRKCVESLQAAAGADPFFSVIVVDNASADDSVERLPTGSAPVTVVRNQENSGFARACNQGARAGTAPFVLFLNPDTRVERVALASSLEFMKSAAGQGIGICGVQLVDEDGHVSRSCARRPTPGRMLGALFGLDRAFPRLVAPHVMVEWDHCSSREVDQVIGAYFLVRRPLFEELGGFDERFFVYYEEVDFSSRAAERGAASYYLVGHPVIHAGAGTTDRVLAFRQFLIARSRTIYARKHFSGPWAMLILAATLVVEPVTRSVHFLLRRDMASVRGTWSAARMLWAELLSRPAVNAERPAWARVS